MCPKKQKKQNKNLSYYYEKILSNCFSRASMQMINVDALMVRTELPFLQMMDSEGASYFKLRSGTFALVID